MSSSNPLVRVSKFVGDAAGLEKTLRLFQSIAQIIAAYALTASAAAPWLVARKQLALGRRYLRVLKFTDAFALALGCFDAERTGGVKRWLEFGKWSCLGFFLGLESLTLLDTMGVYPTAWAGPAFVEAMKFWFYSIVISILLGVMELWTLQFEPIVVRKENKKENDQEKQVQDSQRVAKGEKRSAILKKLVGDVADLFIPGTVTGWMPTSMAGVGWMGVVSTVLSGADIWAKIQRN